jgi:hypothetical protein
MGYWEKTLTFPNRWMTHNKSMEINPNSRTEYCRVRGLSRPSEARHTIALTTRCLSLVAHCVRRQR